MCRLVFSLSLFLVVLVPFSLVSSVSCVSLCLSHVPLSLFVLTDARSSRALIAKEVESTSGEGGRRGMMPDVTFAILEFRSSLRKL